MANFIGGPAQPVRITQSDAEFEIASGQTGQTGVQSTGNSSTTALGAGGAFEGEGEENGYPDIGCYCVSDTDATRFFDFQDELGTWRAFPPAGFAVTANIPEFHTAVKLPRPTRVRLVNGSSPQTSLPLSTFWGVFRQGNAPLNLSIAADADAIIVRSLPTSLDLALGRIGGIEEDTKFGGVKAIDAADSVVDVWRMADDAFANRSDRKTFPTSAQSLFISSDSVSDTDVDVEVEYLDSTGARQTITVNLNGQTAVALGVTALDSNRMTVTNENVNVGNVYLNTANAHTGGVPNDLSTILAFIPANKGQTQQAIFTVPAGFKCNIKQLFVYCSRASGAAGSADVELQTRNNGGAWVTKRDYPVTTSSPLIKDEAGLVFDALTQVRMAVLDVSDTDTNITAEVSYDLAAV